MMSRCWRLCLCTALCIMGTKSHRINGLTGALLKVMTAAFLSLLSKDKFALEV